MKKLLSILAAVGLTATASTAVVACTTTLSGKDVTVTPTADGYKVKTKAFKAKLDGKGITEDMKKGDYVKDTKIKDEFGLILYFDKDKKRINIAKEDLKGQTVTAEKDMKAGDKSIKVSIEIDFTRQGAISLGLVKKDGTVGENKTITIATATKDGKEDKVLVKIKFTAKKFTFTA